MDDDDKVETFYLCIDCNYKTKYKQHFNRHLETLKHYENVNKSVQKFSCECGKSYIYKSGLCKHKKTCTYNETDDDCGYEYEILDGENNNSNLILTLIQQNEEFKQMLIDQNKQIMEMSQTYNNNSNTTNNTFNLQVFLNVTCKDAINMSDFLNSLEVQVEDLEETGRLGYVDGISKIFINKLNELHIHDRPMYCSDLRREIIYIKDNNVWEKETSDRKKLKCIINTITHKNMRQILVWQKNNPEWNDSRSKTNDKYLQIVSNNMNGATEAEATRNYDKIISKIAREIAIPKRNYITAT